MGIRRTLMRQLDITGRTKMVIVMLASFLNHVTGFGVDRGRD